MALNGFDLTCSVEELSDVVRRVLDAYYHKDYVPLLESVTEDVFFIGAGPDVCHGRKELMALCGEDAPMPSFHMEKPVFVSTPLPRDLPEGVEPRLALTVGTYDLLSEGDRPMITAVRQRITLLSERDRTGAWRAFSIHSSNEWNELMEDEVFPVRASTQTHEFVRRILDAQDAAAREADAGPRRIRIETKTGLLLVDVGELVCVRSAGKGAEVVLADGSIDSIRPIGELESVLSPFGLKRVRRDCLLNGRFVRGVTAHDILLTTGESIRIPAKRVSEIRAWIASL